MNNNILKITFSDLTDNEKVLSYLIESKKKISKYNVYPNTYLDKIDCFYLLKEMNNLISKNPSNNILIKIKYRILKFARLLEVTEGQEILLNTKNEVKKEEKKEVKKEEVKKEEENFAFDDAINF